MKDYQELLKSTGKIVVMEQDMEVGDSFGIEIPSEITLDCDGINFCKNTVSHLIVKKFASYKNDGSSHLSVRVMMGNLELAFLHFGSALVVEEARFQNKTLYGIDLRNIRPYDK